MVVISESDVYRLVMKSKLPQAEAFQDWVTEVVLPSIRKTGSYSTAKEVSKRDLFHDLPDPKVSPAKQVGLLGGYETFHDSNHDLPAPSKVQAPEHWPSKCSTSNDLPSPSVTHLSSPDK